MFSMHKKIISTLIICFLLFSMTACRKSDNTELIQHYKNIAMEYINNDDYKAAKEIILEGISITKSDDLITLLELVNNKLSKSAQEKNQAENKKISSDDNDTSVKGENSKKQSFELQAKKIEQYTSTHLDVATTQQEINNESAIIFQEWDNLLNDVYKYLKQTLPTYRFNALEADEIEWIVQKEKAIEEAGAMVKGGSAEIAEKNMTGVKYTKDRCYYLISLVE